MNGKYFASSEIKDISKAKFSELLSNLNFNNKILNQEELKNKLGTSFYRIAVFTEGGILINPAKLVRAMIDVLPRNVELYENSPLIKWNKNNNFVNCQFENNLIQATVIFCTNGFLKSLNIKNFTSINSLLV